MADRAGGGGRGQAAAEKQNIDVTMDDFHWRRTTSQFVSGERRSIDFISLFTPEQNRSALPHPYPTIPPLLKY